MTKKRVAELREADFAAFPVWEYLNDPDDELLVAPVLERPAAHLNGRVVGTHVQLANGTMVRASLANVDGRDPRSTQHFLLLCVYKADETFILRRYHDLDEASGTPEQLGRFLGLPLDAVFPIRYDLRTVALGEPDALAGTVTREPRERLSRAELIGLAVP